MEVVVCNGLRPVQLGLDDDFARRTRNMPRTRECIRTPSSQEGDHQPTKEEDRTNTTNAPLGWTCGSKATQPTAPLSVRLGPMKNMSFMYLTDPS